LPEMYLCHACSHHEVEDGNARAGAATRHLDSPALLAWAARRRSAAGRRPTRPRRQLRARVPALRQPTATGLASQAPSALDDSSVATSAVCVCKQAVAAAAAVLGRGMAVALRPPTRPPCRPLAGEARVWGEARLHPPSQRSRTPRYLGNSRSHRRGAAAVASFWAAILAEMHLCNVCSCQEVLRRNGRGQAAAGDQGPPCAGPTERDGELVICARLCCLVDWPCATYAPRLMAAAYRPRPRRSEGCDRWVIDAPCPLVASHGASIRVMRQMGSRRRVARPPPPPPSSRRQQQQPQQPSPVPHVVRCHICCCCLSGNTPLPIDNIDRHHNVILSPPNAPCCTTRDQPPVATGGGARRGAPAVAGTRRRH
jgi:hypothetical protein